MRIFPPKLVAVCATSPTKSAPRNRVHGPPGAIALRAIFSADMAPTARKVGLPAGDARTPSQRQQRGTPPGRAVAIAGGTIPIRHRAAKARAHTSRKRGPGDRISTSFRGLPGPTAPPLLRFLRTSSGRCRRQSRLDQATNYPPDRFVGAARGLDPMPQFNRGVDNYVPLFHSSAMVNGGWGGGARGACSGRTNPRKCARTQGSSWSPTAGDR